MKIDIRKAYGTVSWDFLENILIWFDFPDKFIKWIMICVTTNFSVTVNKEDHGYFVRRIGLLQGDPVSPLLFVQVMEYLSRIL